MNIAEDWKFRDDLKEDTVPIELLTGPYKGVTFRYTDVKVVEQEHGTAKMQFNYELYQMGEHTETSLRKDTKFTTHIGLILNKLILEVVDDEHRKTDTEGLIEE